MARLDIRIKESGKDSLKLELGGRSRLLYLIIFLFLSTAAFLSIDFSYDFSSSRIGGTLFTFLLILLSLGVTVTVRSFTIDKVSGLLTKNLGLPFGLYNRIMKSWKLGSNPRFVVKSLKGIYPQSQAGGGRLGDTAGMAMAKGKHKEILTLETEESAVILIESSSKADILSTAKYLSAYLGYPTVTEE